MESPQLDLLRRNHPTNENKFIKVLGHKKNGISFWVSLLSIVVYVAVFYMFDLSPSSLLNTTKFWFFISNTLILIIAADFGAFTLSTNHDHQQYYNHQQHPSPATTYSTISTGAAPSKTATLDHLPSFESGDHREITIDAERDVSEELAPQETQLQQNADEIDQSDQEKACDDAVVIGIQEQPTGADRDSKVVVSDEEEEIVEKKEVKCVRSMSEKVILPAWNEDDEEEEKSNSKGSVLRRSKSEGRQQQEGEEQPNEFSTMSDEELNRRVEEFINMFNRQIRLQGARHRQMSASQRTSYVN